MAGENEERPERGPTRRVVVRRENVIVLHPDTDIAALTTLLKAANKGTKGDVTAPLRGGTVGEAWTVVGEFLGDSKDDAIEAHAGKPGTPDAIVGTYKAPTVRAWAGGSKYVAPPKPLVEREAIE